MPLAVIARIVLLLRAAGIYGRFTHSDAQRTLEIRLWEQRAAVSGVAVRQTAGLALIRVGGDVVAWLLLSRGLLRKLPHRIEELTAKRH